MLLRIHFGLSLRAPAGLQARPQGPEEGDGVRMSNKLLFRDAPAGLVRILRWRNP